MHKISHCIYSQTMNVTQHGAKKKRQNAPAKPKKAASSKRKSNHNSRKKSTRGTRKVAIPRTMRIPSKRSEGRERAKFSRANSNMNMTELQYLAKSRGIPFGGLTKTKLIRKINNYY
jgi:hypothetical protein